VIPIRPPELDGVLREERELVLGFGGFAHEIAGGVLVTNERIPVPRFNFVQEVEIARERMSGFFERALDHYFQRALRPAFHLREPPPAFLAEVLERYGFRPRPEPRSALLGRAARKPPPADAGLHVRAAAPEEIDTVVRFWAETREREELRRCLEVLWTHPNPPERVVPLLAVEGGRPVASALLHAFRGVAGIHAVGTQPDARGRGAASAIVAWALASGLLPDGGTVAIWTDQERTRARLERLGFAELARWRVYELDPGAELHLPPVPPSSGPLWRPPRPGRPAP
jgi:GNAT superfamily N-acetyltransferase